MTIEAGGQTSGEGRGLENAARPLLFLTCLFFFNFASRMVLAPLLPTMEQALGFSHAAAGSLYLFIALGYCISMLAAGLVAAALDHRRTIIISAALTGLTTLALALGSSLWAIRLAALALGLACGLYLPSGLATLSSLVGRSYLGRALAVHELAPALTFVAVPLLATALLAWFSWRGSLIVFAAANLALALAFARWGRGGRFKGEPLNLTLLRREALSLPLWRLTGVFTMILGGSVGVYSLLPLFLVSEHHWPLEQANLLLALSRVSGVVMVLLGGWVTDRLGPGRAMFLVTVANGVMTLALGLAQGWWLTGLVFLQPSLTGCFFPAAFAALAYLGPLETSNLRVSLTVATAMAVGFGVVPAGIGLLGEMGAFGVGISILGGLTLLSLALLPGLALGERQPAAGPAGH
ncbi:MAG: MFS transporter [Desulfarculus sp.]|nr:MAG: MFS transporter [Desulfarculus sp.]